MKPFALNADEKGKGLFEGVVLNQEDSIKFSELPREKLAAQVLKGYSVLADDLLAWLVQEDEAIGFAVSPGVKVRVPAAGT